MNAKAAKELKIPFKHKNPARTIVIWSGLNKKERISTIQHEKYESHLMKNGMRYKTAHKRTLKFEKKNLLYPSLKRRKIK